MKRRAQSMRELSQIMSSTFDAELTTRSIQNFSPRSTDIIITPFGKCGQLGRNRFFIRCEHEEIWTSTIFLEWCPG